MKRLLALLLLLPLIAHGATLTVNWTAPTTCSDGSALTNCPITQYTVYSGLSGQPLTKGGTTTPSVLTFSFANTPPGNWCVAVSASSTGGEGPQTTPVCKVVSPPAPGQPGGVTVTLTVTASTAYIPLQQPGATPDAPGRYVMLPVGTVPLGTPCDGATNLNGYNAVPRSAVTFSGLIKPVTPLAQCM